MDWAVSEGTSFFAVLFDPEMLIVSDIDQAVVGLPAVGHHDAVEANFTSDKSLKCLGFYVRNNFGEDSAAALKDTKHRLFIGPAPALAWPWDATRAGLAKVAFIAFDDANKSCDLLALMSMDRRSYRALMSSNKTLVST